MAWYLVLIGILIAAGLVLLAIELLTPMFGLFIGLGLAAMAAAVGVAFIKVSPAFGTAVGVALVVFVPFYLYVLARKLPSSPLSRRIFLGSAPTGTAGSGTPEAAGFEALVGRTGVAETVLRPSGAVRIEGRRLVATAESGMIAKGAAVRVVRSSGMNVVVRAAEQKS